LWHHIRIVANSDYDSRIKGNIDAALTLRLSNLALGGRRFLFSGTMSIPMEELLNRPTILEFSASAMTSKRLFVLGAILLRLVHYRQVVGFSHGELRHVTLIEEAHRLLRAVPETVATRSPNPRGKAWRTFCNLLAELRAYGEGLAVVDQIPTKLAPDIINNTNLKSSTVLWLKMTANLSGAR